MNQAPEGKFAQVFNDAMRDRNVSMKQLAARGEYGYESYRKLSKGMTTPSKDMLRFLHEQLGIDIKKAELAATEDRARRRGMWNVVARAAGKNTELDPIDRVWADLNENDKREVIGLAEMKAKFNRQHAQERRKKSG